MSKKKGQIPEVQAVYERIRAKAKAERDSAPQEYDDALKKARAGSYDALIALLKGGRKPPRGTIEAIGQVLELARAGSRPHPSWDEATHVCAALILLNLDFIRMVTGKQRVDAAVKASAITVHIDRVNNEYSTQVNEDSVRKLIDNPGHVRIHGLMKGYTFWEKNSE